MKTIKIVIAFLVMALSLTWFFIGYNQEYQASTDFDETESHLVVWSSTHVKTYKGFIKNLAEDDQVTLFVPQPTHLDSLFCQLNLYGVNMDNVQLQSITNNNIWIRDFGPVFLNNEKTNKTKILSFNYYNHTENIFPYEYQAFVKERLRASKIVGIGGARELNGKGLAILVEEHELVSNPSLTKDMIAKELRKKIGVKKIIWLKRGLPQDAVFATTPIFENIYTDGANHIDNFCRFISPNTVLLAEVDKNETNTNPISKIANKRLEENYTILKNSLDQDGNPLNIIRIPVAPLLFEKESNFNETKIFIKPTSYLNFIITKNKVIVPSYAQYLKSDEAISKDSKVEIIFKSIFPEKEIVMLDCIELNRSGGGFHCVAINKPKPKKRKKVV
ncbi:agmatine deiminase family protein [Tamlana crocina]|uniref:Agmatine deiminase family protein n=1 Tax=Tamlana crocina TaxID=393006 RepID=A0ABX1DH40_9FLAO|nr:agmatine deiminase family protein [Tamlana crocina]NJX15616.1 agmatine deiminase family protein [Tamlana crocina]